MKREEQLKQATVLTKKSGEALPLLVQTLFPLDIPALSSSCLQPGSQDASAKKGDKDMWLSLVTDFCQ